MLPTLTPPASWTFAGTPDAPVPGPAPRRTSRAAHRCALPCGERQSTLVHGEVQEGRSTDALQQRCKRGQPLAAPGQIHVRGDFNLISDRCHNRRCSLYVPALFDIVKCRPVSPDRRYDGRRPPAAGCRLPEVREIRHRPPVIRCEYGPVSGGGSPLGLSGGDGEPLRRLCRDPGPRGPLAPTMAANTVRIGSGVRWPGEAAPHQGRTRTAIGCHAQPSALFPPPIRCEYGRVCRADRPPGPPAETANRYLR